MLTRHLNCKRTRKHAYAINVSGVNHQEVECLYQNLSLVGKTGHMLSHLSRSPPNDLHRLPEVKYKCGDESLFSKSFTFRTLLIP